MLESLQGNGVLIHHWDTDGICSARLLLERLSHLSVVNTTPVLGNYFLTDEEVTTYSGYEFVIVADMGLPEDNIRQLAKQAQVLIFDHHLQPLLTSVFHQNPLSQGKPAEQYPSASWVVNEFLENPVNVYALLGVVGDHEQRIKKNPVFSTRITEFCSKEGLSFEELLQMVYLLDSSYKIGDTTSVREAPRLLLEYTDARRILQNVHWKNNLTLLEKEIARWVDAASEETKGVLLKRMHTKYNIISTVTRKIAWTTGKDVVVVNTGFFADRDQIYVRSKKNLQPLISQGKALGYRCGGKAEVLGAVVPKDKTEFFVQEILRFLS